MTHPPTCTDPGSRKDCGTCRRNPDNQPEGAVYFHGVRVVWNSQGRQRPDLTETGCRSWEIDREKGE